MMRNNIYIVFLVLFACSTLQIDDSIESVFNNGKESLSKSNYNRAKGEFEFVILNSPLSSYASDAYFYLAESKFYLGKYEDAIIDYEKYLNIPVRDVFLSKKCELMICKSWFNLSNNVMKDQTETKIAIDKLQYYIEKDSMLEYIMQINDMILSLRNRLAEKDFKTALLYMQLEKNESALIYFQNIIDRFYDSNYVEESVLNIAYIKAKENKENAINYLMLNQASFISGSKFQDAIDNISKK